MQCPRHHHRRCSSFSRHGPVARGARRRTSQPLCPTRASKNPDGRGRRAQTCEGSISDINGPRFFADGLPLCPRATREHSSWRRRARSLATCRASIDDRRSLRRARERSMRGPRITFAICVASPRSNGRQKTTHRGRCADCRQDACAARVASISNWGRNTPTRAPGDGGVGNADRPSCFA